MFARDRVESEYKEKFNNLRKVPQLRSIRTQFLFAPEMEG